MSFISTPGSTVLVLEPFSAVILIDAHLCPIFVSWELIQAGTRPGDSDPSDLGQPVSLLSAVTARSGLELWFPVVGKGFQRPRPRYRGADCSGLAVVSWPCQWTDGTRRR